MKKKELSEIKKSIKATEDSTIVRIVACYIDTASDAIYIQDPQLFGNLPMEYAEQYNSFIRKGFGGKPGKTGFSLPVNSDQILYEILESELKDKRLIEKFCENLRLYYGTDDNYGVLLAYGIYDVPTKKDSEGGDIYKYIVTQILPCKISSDALYFDFSSSSYQEKKKTRDLSAPMHTFIYPSFNDRSTDLYEVYYQAKTEKCRMDIIHVLEKVLGTKLPLSPEDQKDVFRKLINIIFDNAVEFDVIQSIYSNLAVNQAEAEIDGGVAVMTVGELADAILLEKEDTSAVLDTVDKEIKDIKNLDITLNNILAKSLEIETSSATIKTDPKQIDNIRKETFDGSEYYLIPVFGSSIDRILISEANRASTK